MNKEDTDQPDILIISAREENEINLEGSPSEINIDDFIQDISTLDLSGLTNNLSNLNYPTNQISVGMGQTGNTAYNSSILTSNSNNWYTPYTISAPKPGQFTVTGDAEFEGDVKIQGRSLLKTLEAIEKRLSILVPNQEKLEHFEALRKAYEHYKTLEALCDLPPKEDEN